MQSKVTNKESDSADDEAQSETANESDVSESEKVSEPLVPFQISIADAVASKSNRYQLRPRSIKKY